MLTRIVIALLLLAMLPAGFVTLAAAGSTLSDPGASDRVGAIVLIYLALDIGMLASIAMFHASARFWILAAAVAIAPMATFLIGGWVRGSF